MMNLSRIFSLFKIALFVAAITTGQAGFSATVVELDQVESGLLGGELGYGDKLNLALFQPFQRILILSDGIGDSWGYQNQALKNPGGFSIGERLARAFPDKTIVQTDFNIEAGDEVKEGNHQLLHIDNRKLFPFPDNHFDLILFRKGLCLCCRGKPCGGFSDSEEEGRKFFNEIARILNKLSPFSLAVLHGQEYNKEKIAGRWSRLISEIEKATGLQGYLGYAEHRTGFKEGDKSITARPFRLELGPDSRPQFNSLVLSTKPILQPPPAPQPSGKYQCGALMRSLKNRLIFPL